MHQALGQSNTNNSTNLQGFVNHEDRIELSPVEVAVRTATKSSDDPTATGILCVTTLASADRCSHFCGCQCHVKNHVATPRWLSHIFGSLFYSYIGRPHLQRRACNYPLCRKTGDPTGRLMYYFPSWWAAKAFSFSCTWNDLGGRGASWSIKMPQLVSNLEPVWNFIQIGTISQIRDLFDKRWASPFDCQVDGKSVLHVCSDLYDSEKIFQHQL